VSLNLGLLEQLIRDKYVSVQKHPQAELYIYNYTPLTQFDRNWNEITLACRGLILDSEYNIVARPFPKFFNLEEHQSNEIPREPFEIYNKLDGSLGILYWLAGKPKIATRGSFNSEQAQIGTNILERKYQYVYSQLNPEYTYLFEIIYPENRIVIDYGDTNDLILLSIRKTATGEELPLNNIGFPLVERYDGITEIAALKKLKQSNREGFVIRFASGFRVKVKFEEYVRLHRLVTKLSNKTIWELLANNKSLETILDNVPDEWYDWVKKVDRNFKEQYRAIEAECQQVFQVFPLRKEAAEYYQTQKYPGILFAMLDKKDYSQIIWKILKPKYNKPFKTIDSEQ
jgi:T4 RnlA family RNA ligase